MIGLLDLNWELSTSTQFLIPNIEIMKLATYYKIEENQFCRLLSLDEPDLNNYDKIYCFNEITRDFILPENYLRTKNIIYGGSAFTNGKYIPFENEIIDFTIPRPAIYKESLKKKYNEGIKSKVINHVLDDTYYRNYAGKNKLPLPRILPNKRVILYDVDFFYDDWEETIQIITERRPSSIKRIHPIICKTLTQYFTMRKYSKLSRENDIILDLDIPLNEVGYMLKNYKNLFLADITNSSNVFLKIGGTWQTNIQYSRDFIYKLNLLYSFWGKGILIKIKYLPPNIGNVNPISHLTQILEVWTNSMIKKDRHDVCLNDKIPKKKKDNVLLEEKKLIMKDFPAIEGLFMQTFSKLSKEGRWTI